MLDEITALFDSGAGAANVKIYDGTVPANESAALSGNTLLGTLPCSDPSAAAASGGVLTLSAITSDSSADATGTATFFRVEDSDANVVMQGAITATGGGGEMELNSTSVTTGQEISITAWTVTMPH